VTTVLGGAGAEPRKSAIDKDGTFLILADWSAARKYDIPADGNLPSQIAAKATEIASGFQHAIDVAIDPVQSSFVLVIDQKLSGLYKVPLAGGAKTLIAGSGDINDNGSDVDGSGSSARFTWPVAVDIHPDGTYALVADHGNGKIKKVMLSSPYTTTTVATVSSPRGIALHPSGTYALVVSRDSDKIYKLDLTKSPVEKTVLASALTTYNEDIAINSGGQYALVASNNDQDISHVNLFDPSKVTLLATATGSSPTGVCISPSDTYALVSGPTGNGQLEVKLTSCSCSDY
jgi:DNA-binding beta-propeller fold protein YncE